MKQSLFWSKNYAFGIKIKLHSKTTDSDLLQLLSSWCFSWISVNIWKSRLDWLIFQNSGFLTMYSCAECLFLFGILLRYWYLHYIIVFVLMHLEVKRNIFNFVSLLNEIWRTEFELLILFLRLFDCLYKLIVWWIWVIKWSKNQIDVSFLIMLRMYNVIF